MRSDFLRQCLRLTNSQLHFKIFQQRGGNPLLRPFACLESSPIRLFSTSTSRQVVMDTSSSPNSTHHGVQPTHSTKSSESGSRLAARPTVGIIVIGDEILKGQTHDSNSHFMCRRLHQRGVVVKRVTVVGDRVDEIATEVRDFAARYDYVFTTGGIGTTHDDRTFEALGAAFDERLEENAELRRFVQTVLEAREKRIREGMAGSGEKPSIDLAEAVEKFCRIPVSTRLVFAADRRGGVLGKKAPLDGWEKGGGDSAESGNHCSQNIHPPSPRFPSFQLRNVIAFPGVPAFCELSFLHMEESLFSEVPPFFTRTLHLSRSELNLAAELNRVVEGQREGEVTIGSYPVLGNPYFKTKLSVESEVEEDGQKAFSELESAFKDYVVDYDEEPWINPNQKLANFISKQAPEFREKIQRSLDTIDTILKEYSLEQISLSFNGGKDCTLLLHLLRCRVDERYGPGTSISAFHILSNDEFPQLTEFVADVSKKYRLRVRQLFGHLKGGLAQLKAEQPSVVAVLMGSRATDPSNKPNNGSGELCQWTDGDWPKFYRVCPLMEWRYSEVWRAIRSLSIPYCHLYDQGYTSLGDASRTQPNPALLLEGAEKNNEDGEKEKREGRRRRRYRPAYELKDEHLERSSRWDLSTMGGPTVA